jgi:hypothetical protein
MSNFRTIADERMRCPRCSARPAVQNAVELRPGIKCLTLRCISCGIVYNAQVVADPAAASHLVGRTYEPPQWMKRRRPGPMETQPNFDAGESQATLMGSTPSKRTKKANRIGAPAILRSEAEIARKVSLNKQRGLLQAANIQKGRGSQGGAKNARRRKT